MHAGESSPSVYEQWVVSLRAWRNDPFVDLHGLPPIDESSFPPSTYQRFLRHLNDAINSFMKVWSTRLSAALAEAHDSHELGRALVDARRGLACRLALARHPSFPEHIRQQLVEQAVTDIQDLQKQMEDRAAQRGGSTSSIARAEIEESLRIVRSNAFTAVLDPNFAAEPAAASSAASAADQTDHRGNPQARADRPLGIRRPARRVVVDSSED